MTDGRRARRGDGRARAVGSGQPVLSKGLAHQRIRRGRPLRGRGICSRPARHMRLTPFVGSLARGRFGDVVLLSDVDKLAIAEVWADGRQVSEGIRYTGPVPTIQWPDWATRTIKIGRAIEPDDFVLAAEP